jgi:hypothetical protein
MKTCADCRHWKPLLMDFEILGSTCELTIRDQDIRPGMALRAEILGGYTPACQAFEATQNCERERRPSSETKEEPLTHVCQIRIPGMPSKSFKVIYVINGGYAQVTLND